MERWCTETTRKIFLTNAIRDGARRQTCQVLVSVATPIAIQPRRNLCKFCRAMNGVCTAFHKKGQGWVGDGRTWDLDVGALGARVYFSGQNQMKNRVVIPGNG